MNDTSENPDARPRGEMEYECGNCLSATTQFGDCPVCGTAPHEVEQSSDGTPQELVVEFTQRFTVKPPEDVDNPIYAEDWFWNFYSDIGWDAVDVRRKKHYEVIDVRERGSDE